MANKDNRAKLQILEFLQKTASSNYFYQRSGYLNIKLGDLTKIVNNDFSYLIVLLTQLQIKDKIFEIKKVTRINGFKDSYPKGEKAGIYFFSDKYHPKKEDIIKFKISSKFFAKKLNEYKAKVQKPPLKQKIALKIKFDQKTGKIIYGNKKCSIPYDTKQYDLCKIMFAKEIKERVDWDEIADNWKGYTIGLHKEIPKRTDWREVYDAVRAVNEKVKKKLGIERIFQYKNKTVMRLE